MISLFRIECCRRNGIGARLRLGLCYTGSKFRSSDRVGATIFARHRANRQMSVYPEQFFGCGCPALNYYLLIIIYSLLSGCRPYIRVGAFCKTKPDGNLRVHIGQKLFNYLTRSLKHLISNGRIVKLTVFPSKSIAESFLSRRSLSNASAISLKNVRVTFAEAPVFSTIRTM